MFSDDSGSWGQGGLFSALKRRSPKPEVNYELAGKMKGMQRIVRKLGQIVRQMKEKLMFFFV